MPLEAKDLERGTELFLRRLEEIVDTEPEVSDIHDAFEFYCSKRFSLGNSASNDWVGGKNDLGIDFSSQLEHSFHVGQCKIPERDYLEAHPTKPKVFGPQAVGDVRDALRYLTGDSDLKPNERVQRLYSLIANDRGNPNFSLTLFVVVFGRLNQRGLDAFKEFKEQFQSNRITIVLQELDDLVNEFLVGAGHTSEEMNLDLRTNTEEVLRSRDYCYFLANAADLYKAFTRFGWRLFDLNLRYEVRNSSINGEIVGSLTHQKSRRQFHHYNNGLIVTAKRYKINDQEKKIRIFGAQIVNGLQTVKSIYNAVVTKEVTLEEIEKDCVVQVKVIATPDHDFISRVVRATNNQNPMAPRNLRSNSREQKVLRTGFALPDPKWFYQLKEGEWDSLTGESAHFFEQVVGYKASAFRAEPTRKYGRVIDNQDAAKAWLRKISANGFGTGEAGDFHEPTWQVSTASLLPAALQKHAATFIEAKNDLRFPKSSRPTSRLKQIWFLARALAGAELGVSTRTAINLLGAVRPDELQDPTRLTKRSRRAKKTNKKRS